MFKGISVSMRRVLHSTPAPSGACYFALAQNWEVETPQTPLQTAGPPA